MNENQLRELFKTNEANQTMEATFYETQKSLALIAKQAKYFYDQLILQGFNEGQAMEFMMRTFLMNILEPLMIVQCVLCVLYKSKRSTLLSKC